MKRWIARALVVAGVLSGLALSPASAAPELLPNDVTPLNYNLSVAPDAAALTWQGKDVIAIMVRRPVSDMVLNAEDLAFDRVTLDGVRNATTTLDAGRAQATLHFAAPIAPGPHILAIDYHGKIGRETLGFFAMDYETSSRSERALGTNFEPASARKFLPCWDEPARKATFRLSVDVPNDRTAVSNMPVQSVEQISPTLKRVHFATTPKMSTYLLFLGIGDFERIHRAVDGVDVGVVVKRGDAAKGAYALDQAVQLLHFYDDYFGYHFPLPKLDLVAAPGEIEGSSMENWGAIFCSQDDVLFDPAKSTEPERQGVFEVVSHEMAHQWFGDLVTMAWWDNLWLNEGFASWMQVHAADALHPEWRTGLKAQSIFEGGKQADAEPSTHPVVQDVDTAAQALQAFDAITYSKGAAVITMLNAYIGPDAFRDGMQRYMKAHAFGNAVDADLWSIMQTVAKKPILQIEHDFTRQEGLPLICLSQPEAGLHLAEMRFFDNARSGSQGDAQIWSIPVSIAAPGASGQQILLKDPITLPIHDAVLVNAGQTAYARVLYPENAFLKLVPAVPDLAPVDQLGLINDGFALGLAAYAPPENAFIVAQKLRPSADPIVWQRVTAIVMTLDRHYTDGPARSAFRAFARALLAPALSQIGDEPRPGENSNISELRDDLAATLGHLGDDAVIARARQLLASGGGTPDEQRTALDIAAETAGASEFEPLLDRARKSQDPFDKQRIYESLSGVADPTLARRMIGIALSNEVPAGSNAGMISALAYYHPDLVWDEAIPHLADPAVGMARDEQWDVIREVASGLSDQGRVAEVQAYIDAHVPADARRPFAGAIAAIQDNHRIATRVLPYFDHWIAAQTKP
jgi:aminopeptidase N